MGIACLLHSRDFFNGRKNGPHEKNVYGKNRKVAYRWRLEPFPLGEV